MNLLKKRPEEPEDHEDHVDERWLVSYADMMTLLFGLFVILFSIASENVGQFKENLKALSISSTQNAEVKEDKIPEPNYIQLNAELEIKLNQSLLEIEKLKNQMTSLEENRNQSEKTINQLKEELSFKNKPQIDPIAQKLKKELQDTVLDNQKLKSLVAQLSKSNLEKNNLDKNKIERNISSLQNSVADSENQLNQKKTEISDLKEKMSDLQKQNSKLESELAQAQKDAGSDANSNKTYLFLLFKWSTEKHDLDLTVKDPVGNVFSFKKKKFSGSNGHFSLDSRSGPGAEIWQATNPTPGQYTVTIKMYNNYGNLEPAEVFGSILSNKTSISLSNKKIEAKSGSSLSYVLNVDEKGFVQLK